MSSLLHVAGGKSTRIFQKQATVEHWCVRKRRSVAAEAYIVSTLQPTGPTTQLELFACQFLTDRAFGRLVLTVQPWARIQIVDAQWSPKNPKHSLKLDEEYSRHRLPNTWHLGNPIFQIQGQHLQVFVSIFHVKCLIQSDSFRSSSTDA